MLLAHEGATTGFLCGFALLYGVASLRATIAPKCFQPPVSAVSRYYGREDDDGITNGSIIDHPRS